jgi:hypothetical protein
VRPVGDDLRRVNSLSSTHADEHIHLLLLQDGE